VAWDIHNHLLPGVDDGVRDLDEFLACVRLMTTLGYRGAVITPHLFADAFDTTERMLRERYEAFLPVASPRLEGFRLHLAGEYMMDERFLNTLYGHADDLLRFGPGMRHFLMELPTTIEPVNLADVLAECGRQGLTPVIAHVERYLYVTGTRSGMDRLRAWRERGALLQVNVGSFAGQYGRDIQQAAKRVWAQSLVDALGSDMHRPTRAETALPEGWDYVAKHGNGFDPAVQASLMPEA
jgi:tyrosine-protein phosphatase YwqE